MSGPRRHEAFAYVDTGANIPMGIWRHYKGPLYQVLGLAHDANDETRTGVVYIGLQLDAAHLGPRLSVRTLSSDSGAVDAFLDYVCGDRECPDFGDKGFGDLSCPAEHSVARFAYLGRELTAEMLPASLDAPDRW